MEFSRFGGNITNGYWGCCACCIIQDFNQDPDAKSSIQLVDGDGATAILGNGGKQLYAGPTYRDIFLQRLRFGTFSTTDMPNHAFLAILTQGQINNTYGKKWLELLKQTGFEFIRTINNSVYTGQTLLDGANAPEFIDFDDVDCDDESPVHGNAANYLFGLFRNIGKGAAENPFVPPKEWIDLPEGSPAAIDAIGKEAVDMAKEQQAFHRKVWDELPKQDTLLTEEQLREKDVPVWLSGKRVDEARPKIKRKEAPQSKEAPLKSAGLPFKYGPPIAFSHDA
jgi:hypothetical protein